MLLVDQHTLVREAIKNALTGQEGIEVVDHVASIEQGVQCVLRHFTDIVVMDYSMTGMIASEGARKITQLSPETKVIFLSDNIHDHLIDSALIAGAMGYLNKEVELSFLIHAILEVASGRTCFSPDIKARLVIDNDRIRVMRTVATRYSSLTPRQREVLQYLGRGLPKKNIARIMKIKVKTVDKHAENLMQKLDIHDRVELSRYAIREGIVQP